MSIAPSTQDPVEDAPVPDVDPVTYPDTTVGMLMRERDGARANAAAARDQCSRFATLATDADARADSLQVAIDAMPPDQS